MPEVLKNGDPVGFFKIGSITMNWQAEVTS